MEAVGEPESESVSEPESVRLIIWDTPSEPESIPEPEPEPVPVRLTDEFEVMSDTEEVDLSGIDISESRHGYILGFDDETERN